ncbi:dynamin family protein [Helicobacter sp. MIT 21-1697]|uniref:dynamin family protein n=1 Tax=Helicobacter sp. MIT 21-1697 TaxID=2993733 RepID=UPI00224B0C22|nr:dynamin family protein [Helicobacter sp. MIT 21-1697]MCX2717698.1 dynamin family protein [Helicobacter sp. MIT 21-1697]
MEQTNENLLEDFINEYISAKNQLLQGGNPLYALIDKTHYALSQIASLDSHASHTLQSLTQSIQEPMKVAVIGQFSSGKSTFLNALLGKNILPSGITPITAKICHIVYGQDYALEIHYKNGNTATKTLSYLNEANEVQNAKIAFYKLYAPLEILKKISFLDTPGFNSQNQSDTDTTNSVLESVDGIIWLTLIDNVGKHSEKEIIQSHIKRYASKSLCVLNQKDRLKNQDEINTSLEYAKRAFNGLFEEILAISAKNALLSYDAPQEQRGHMRADSQIDFVLDFLHTHIAPLAQESKKRTILTQLRILTLKYARLSFHAYLRFTKCEALLADSARHFTEQYPQSAFYTSFPTLFHTLESHLESLTQHIYNALERTPKDFMRVDKKFGIKTQNTQTKDITTLPRERLSLSLCNTDSTFARHFTKLGFDITATGEEFNALLNTHIGHLNESIIQWYEAFIPALQNSLLQKTLNEIMEAYDELVREHCEHLNAQLMLFAKIITLNYPLAVNLCLNTISLKIQEALEKYTKTPDTLPLFNPTLENIRDELNAGFHFGFLQENLLTQPLHKKALWHFEREQKALCVKQSAIIVTYKEQYIHHFKQLKSLLQILKNI